MRHIANWAALAALALLQGELGVLAEPVRVAVPPTIELQLEDGTRTRIDTDSENLKALAKRFVEREGTAQSGRGATDLLLDCAAVRRMQNEVARAKKPRTVPAAPGRDGRNIKANTPDAPDADTLHHLNDTARHLNALEQRFQCAARATQ
jgi:hypothetical protein